jgi:hypothetical protein
VSVSSCAYTVVAGEIAEEAANKEKRRVAVCIAAAYGGPDELSMNLFPLSALTLCRALMSCGVPK